VPSTGAGSCLGIFTDTVRKPLQQARTIAQNITKYAAPVAPLLPGMAAQIASMREPISNYTYRLNPDGQTVTSILSATCVALTSGAAAIAQAAQWAVKATPAGLVFAVDGTFAVGVFREGKAAFSGGCKP
jgi:hypothetical protein